MPRVRVAERRAVEAALSEYEYDTVADAAEAVIIALDEARAQRKYFVVISWHPEEGIIGAFGLYGTVREAHKALGDSIISYREGTKAILRILNYDPAPPIEEEE